MAIFKILFSRPKVKQIFDQAPEFDLQVISGNLEMGDKFVVYETHHPIEFEILDIIHGPITTIAVNYSIPYINWHQGTTVDTQKPELGVKFGYRQRDAQKLYHPSILEKYSSEDVKNLDGIRSTESYKMAEAKTENFATQVLQIQKVKRQKESIQKAVKEATFEMKQKNFHGVVKKLKPFESSLSKAQLLKLEYAEKRTNEI